jgi:hypothetical protein
MLGRDAVVYLKESTECQHLVPASSRKKEKPSYPSEKPLPSI